ncbi:MAG: ATP-binding protein [Candidatus Omnitrophica bacterium]|nr:ATP-binding protein [Candidatus Omnitrophota bacterium]
MFSDPVVGDDFFGRQEIIDLLIKRASALKSGYRQNVAIIGHQQLGKTSILRHFLHLYNDPQTLSIYVEIKLQAVDYFVEQFTRSLLFQYLSRASKVDPTETLAGLSEKAVVSIPKTVARIEEIACLLKSRRAEEAYSRLFDLTSSVKQETGLNCIVILDEFHRLGEFGIKNAFSDFGKKIMVQKDTMYLLSSSAFSASRKILAEKLALLFGNFERIYLKVFDFETSFRFLEKRLGPLGIPDLLKSFVVAFTDGHPFFLENVASRLREIGLSKNESEVSRQTLAEALQKLLYESQGVLNQYFMKLVSPWTQSSSRGTQLLILTEMAKGKNKLKEISAAINRSQREISREIQELMAHELILKTGVFYRFHNKIFKFWLREVYEKKELSLLGTSAKAEDFLSRIQTGIDEHEAISRMALGDRVLKLFRLFNNDIVEFGEKKRRLPHFTEFIRTSGAAKRLSDAESGRIIAKGHGRCWLCQIVEEKASEREILDLVEHGEKNAPQATTRVLVALRGLDDNAKLLAKEKRILTLGLSRINMLMDIYGKVPIIHPASKEKPLEHVGACKASA